MVSVTLLIDGNSLEMWQWRAVDHLLENTQAEITTVISNQNSEADFSIKELLEGPYLWKAYSASRIVSQTVSGEPWYKKRVDIPHEWRKISVKPEPADGMGCVLPESAIAELENCDIGVRFGFGILRGEALTAPTYGVLSYHHGDLREYRGRPAGFWEFLNNEEYAAVTVQILSNQLDAGKVASLKQTVIKDCSSWPEVLDRLFADSEPLLSEAVQNIIENNEINKPNELGELYTRPGFVDTLKYFTMRLY